MDPLNPEGADNSPEDSLRDSFKDFWKFVLGRVMLAMGLFSVGTFVLHLLLGVVFTSYPGNLELGVIVVSITVGFLRSIVLAGVVGVFVLAIGALVFWKLSVNPRQSYVAGFFGGLTAYVSQFGFNIHNVFFSSLEWEYVSHIIFLILLATVMGQVAGVLGYKRALAVNSFQEPCYQLPDWPRFQVRHILWATFWCGLSLATLKIAGTLTTGFVLTSGAWLILQLGTLALILRVMENRRARATSE